MSVLISFEGIDGSGKSTVIEKIKNIVKNSIITREPRGTKLGYNVWKMLNDSMVSDEELIKGKRTNLFLFLSSHSEHVETIIKPSLEENKNVLVDRYIDSTFVHQCLNKNLEVQKVFEIMKDIIGTPIPEITFVFDVEPEIAQKRLNKRREETGEFTNFDSIEIDFQKKIRKFFYKIKEIFPERINIINANQNPDEVFNDVEKILVEKNII